MREYFDPSHEDWDDVCAWVVGLADDPDVCFVSHNSAFDTRVCRHILGSSQPQRDHCTLELSKAAYPSQAGGHSLQNLGTVLPGMPAKIAIDLLPGRHTPKELELYCLTDVDMCARVHELALNRLPGCELLIHEMTTKARELYFEVDPAKVESALIAFTAAAENHAAEVAALFEGSEAHDSFGWEEDGSVRSVKPHALKDLLREECGFVTDTISKKKLNAGDLERNPRAAEVINAAALANKHLSHKRRVVHFLEVTLVDVAFMYYAGHTGRWSGRGTGKGVNIHNLPKHNKLIAQPLRSMYRLPAHLCFVRVDLANVEYRCECWATENEHATRIFLADTLADPYAAFWHGGTGQKITKADPIRQVAKAAVLGLGFLMGVRRWMSELLNSLADPVFNISLADLEDICKKQGWRKSKDKWILQHAKKIHAPWAVASVAEHTHRIFHEVHPEFARLADWLVKCAEAASRALHPQAAIDKLYRRRGAPDIERIRVEFDDSRPGERGLRVSCGNWTPTIYWRDLAVRRLKRFDKFEMCLSMMREGHKAYRAVTRQILIENVMQSLARNAMCETMLQLKDRGYEHILSVHDELLLAVPRNPESVCKARDDLLDILAPGNGGAGYGWAITVDAEEIECSQSWWAEPQSAEWWAALSTHPELLESLP